MKASAWSELDELPVKVCGVFLTRRCNLSCKYCSVSKTKLEELTVGKWQEAFSVVNGLGIEKVAILGGEPTIVPGLEDIISFIDMHTNIDCNVISNSTITPDYLKRLVRAGLKRYSTSIDTLVNKGFDRFSTIKSNLAVKTLLLAKDLGIENITAYIVLSRRSIDQVEEIARFLTSHAISTYLIPLQHGEGDYWENRATASTHAFRDSDMTRLQDFGARMVELKNQGQMVTNSDKFLLDLYRYAIKLNWHCLASTSELRLDADGSLMCCNDIKGSHSSRFSIFDLNKRKGLNDFQTERALDAANCPGCYWPSQVHATDARIAQTKLEGVFVRERK